MSFSGSGLSSAQPKGAGAFLCSDPLTTTRCRDSEYYLDASVTGFMSCTARKLLHSVVICKFCYSYFMRLTPVVIVLRFARLTRGSIMPGHF
ncbi:hypothetical protein AcV5_007138 [Taiwanofungus camphoratus]|nr:hypothetical protein AcV5_007138 [Antrodia cinnamomea]KAI0958658.1 hypothetical protein AcV7_004409 [Antrodia cinnamomea]